MERESIGNVKAGEGRKERGEGIGTCPQRLNPSYSSGLRCYTFANFLPRALVIAPH